MKLTAEFLAEKGACTAGLNWFTGQKKTLVSVVLKELIKADHLNWANWLIVRVLDYKGYVKYAVFAAQQVLDIYEIKYPNDGRPRAAIEAALKCVKNPSEDNKKAADAAADAAYAAAYAADAAYTAAAYAAAYAAAAAAYAADAAADAAYAAAYTAAAADAAYAAAAYAADAAYARKKMQIKILKYGMTLLKRHEIKKETLTNA